jgi:hypothetical protein
MERPAFDFQFELPQITPIPEIPVFDLPDLAMVIPPAMEALRELEMMPPIPAVPPIELQLETLAQTVPSLNMRLLVPPSLAMTLDAQLDAERQAKPKAKAEADEREQERKEREIERKEREKEREQDLKERENDLYSDGNEYLDEGKYEQAAQKFAQVVEMKSKRADAALYWMAYCRAKQGRKDEALLLLKNFLSTYPESRWTRDAKALDAELKQASGASFSATEDDCELKELALRSIMQNSDSESAVPVLEKSLGNNLKCRKLPERALFVLAQIVSRNTKARDLMARIARGEMNPDLQRKAIQYIAIHGGREARQILEDIYNSTADKDIKRQILRSYLPAGDKERVLKAARTEKDPELRREAIRVLGPMGARDELWQLYQTETDGEVKAQLIQGIFVSGDRGRMSELAKAEKDPDLRRKAIRNLGIMGKSETSAATLLEIYKSDKDQGVRKEVLNAFFLQGNAAALVELARQENDPEMKKAIVSKLSIMRSPEAMAYLMELLNK